MTRQNFNADCEDFFEKISFLSGKSPKDEWNKVPKILKRIKQGIEYDENMKLKGFVKELIYN